MNLQEIYTKLKLTEDSLIRVSADKNWQKKVALPSRIYRLLEKNDLLKTLDAFFCFDNKPLILFFNLENSNRKQELHKAIWNFNESPIAIIVENNAVEIFNGFSIDETDGSCCVFIADWLLERRGKSIRKTSAIKTGLIINCWKTLRQHKV